MTKLQQLIIAVNSFSAGLLVPVLNLILLERGASLQTLPLILAIYSTTVLCLELPSGILADIYGRKAVFLLSCVFQAISLILLILAGNMVWLIFAVIFFGLGRAFSSGSLDALFIDQALTRHGEGCLARVTTRLSVLESCGLALGAVTGGIISDTAGSYSANILLRIIFTITLFSLCTASVKEQLAHDKARRIPLTEHLRQGRQIIFSASGLHFIFIGVFFLGFFLSTIETYWQPAFLEISADKGSTWMLGLITFTGFFAVVLGSIIAQKVLDRLSRRWWSVYNVCRITFSACILTFAFQKSIPGFVALYACVYMMLGAGNAAEGALINKFTPNSMRASMLSLNSLIAQIGSLCASVFSSIMILKLQFTGIWLAAGVLLGGYAIIATVATSRRKSQNSDYDNSIMT